MIIADDGDCCSDNEKSEEQSPQKIQEKPSSLPKIDD